MAKRKHNLDESGYLSETDEWAENFNKRLHKIDKNIQSANRPLPDLDEHRAQSELIRSRAGAPKDSEENQVDNAGANRVVQDAGQFATDTRKALSGDVGAGFRAAKTAYKYGKHAYDKYQKYQAGKSGKQLSRGQAHHSGNPQPLSRASQIPQSSNMETGNAGQPDGGHHGVEPMAGGDAPAGPGGSSIQASGGMQTSPVIPGTSSGWSTTVNLTKRHMFYIDMKKDSNMLYTENGNSAGGRFRGLRYLTSDYYELPTNSMAFYLSKAEAEAIARQGRYYRISKDPSWQITDAKVLVLNSNNADATPTTSLGGAIQPTIRVVNDADCMTPYWKRLWPQKDGTRVQSNDYEIEVKTFARAQHEPVSLPQVDLLLNHTYGDTGDSAITNLDVAPLMFPIAADINEDAGWLDIFEKCCDRHQMDSEGLGGVVKAHKFWRAYQRTWWKAPKALPGRGTVAVMQPSQPPDWNVMPNYTDTCGDRGYPTNTELEAQAWRQIMTELIGYQDTDTRNQYRDSTDMFFPHQRRMPNTPTLLAIERLPLPSQANVNIRVFFSVNTTMEIEMDQPMNFQYENPLPRSLYSGDSRMYHIRNWYDGNGVFYSGNSTRMPFPGHFQQTNDQVIINYPSQGRLKNADLPNGNAVDEDEMVRRPAFMKALKSIMKK